MIIDNTERENLPIQPFLERIVSCPAQYIIVTAETGSGKSTMIPLAFNAMGNRVLVTEPLRETVLGTSEFVARHAVFW